MKLIGLDYGRRRIGIAVTDENGEYIRGLPTLDRNKVFDFLAALSSTIASEKAQRIIIGLPLDINGDDTVMSREIRLFAERLAELTGQTPLFVDESMSSVEAASLMRFRKKKDRRRKDAADRVAACLILEAFQKGLTCA
jgi:putative Holliday junction resolvase